MNANLPRTALAYDDVLLRPNYSETLPSDAILKSKFSKNIDLNIPIVSAAMDTVTESNTAIVLAQNGGIGVIHKNLPPKLQAKEVKKVKRYETGIILDPIITAEDATIEDILKLTTKNNITGLPVIDSDYKLLGIITNRDIRFAKNNEVKVKELMTKREKLIVGTEDITLEDAKSILHKHRIEKLPIVSSSNKLIGLITIKDIQNLKDFPNSNKDSQGRLRVAAAIGVGPDEFERAKALAEAEVDAIIIDTAHGHTKGVIEMVKKLKSFFKNIDIVAGNIATAKACIDLIEAGADGIKVGIGPGSICTTRVIAGIGVPQFSAILDCYEICRKNNIPYIADGGIKYSGDIVKALAAGASCIMVGSLFAGTDESPGEMVIYHGRSYKVYRGMGSIGAMRLGSKDRYGQAEINDAQKLVPEGIEGQVPYRGPLSSTIYQLLGGLKAGMGYVGAKTISELQEKADFIQISPASLKENHPHDVIITKEAPNYSI